MFNNKEKLLGQSAFVMKRCSSNGQIKTSIDNQSKTTEQAIDELHIKVVDEISLEGVSGSVPGNRTDIDAIIYRKRIKNDFTVLVVQDTSRFTRSGQGHGQKLLYELRAAGILVYFVAEDLLVDCEMAEMYASFLFAAARHAVKTLAYNAVVGSTNSFLSGRSPYTRRPPFGLDRMYSDGGIDLHIIRNMPDGTQEQLTPQGELMRRFAKNQKKGVPCHYIKQKSEQIRLIPGNPIWVALVHLIFHLHYVEGLSYRAISLHLNDAATPSPEGKDWHTNSVRKILLNPVYIGQGIRCRSTRAIYYEADEGSPAPSAVTLQELANNVRVKSRLRPREKWLERPQPHLEDFLPEPVRNLATAATNRHLDSIADAKPKKPNKDRHRNSPCLLKGILRSKQGNHLMTGRVGGKGTRSYGVSRAITAPRSNNVLAGRIPAQPLEDAVLGVVREVVLCLPNLQDVLKNLILQHARQHHEDTENPEKLKKAIERKQKQLALLSDDVELEEDDLLSRKASAIKAEIRQLKQRLQHVPKQKTSSAGDLDALASVFAKELLDTSKALDAHDIPHLCRLLSLLIGKMEADLVTKEVEIEFSLPSWVGKALLDGGPMGLDELSACRPFIEAPADTRLILGTFQCDQHGRPACYTCRRTKKAA